MFGTRKSFSQRLFESKRYKLGEIAYALKEEEFLKLEYAALRNEIEQTLARRFRILATGVFGIPTAAFAITELEARGFLFFLPFLVTVLVMVYVAESNALMRCGRYIREEIEPRVDGALGWETWLEAESSRERRVRRTSDRLMKYAFFILSLVYFIVSVVLFYEKDLVYLSTLFGQVEPVAASLGAVNSAGLAINAQHLIIFVTASIFLVLMLVTLWVMVRGTPSMTSLSAPVEPKPKKPVQKGQQEGQ